MTRIDGEGDETPVVEPAPEAPAEEVVAAE